jgi:hypothetical protein
MQKRNEMLTWEDVDRLIDTWSPSSKANSIP